MVMKYVQVEKHEYLSAAGYHSENICQEAV